MNEIPDDIEARLTAAVSEFFARKFGGEYEGDVFIDLLRDAILAERERCAAIAKEAADTFDRCGPLSLGSTAGDVWFRIRQGQAKEGEGA